MGAIETVAMLSLLANRLVEVFVKPFAVEYKINEMWLTVSAWGIGFGLVMLTNADIFSGVFIYPIAGKILTAVVAGGGANLIADVVNSLGKNHVQETKTE